MIDIKRCVLTRLLSAQGLVLSPWCILWVLMCSLPLFAQAEDTDTDAEVVSETDNESGGETPANPIKRVHLIPEALKEAALADEAVNSQIVWIDSPEGDSMAEEEAQGTGKLSSFLALELFESAAESQGAVLFLHGAEQHADWPTVIKPLRTLLPDDGWYTLSIMLPYKDSPEPPERELAAKVNDTVSAVAGSPRYSNRYAKVDVSSDKTENGDELEEGNDVEGGGESVVEGDESDNASTAEVTDSVSDSNDGGSETSDPAEEVIDVSADDDATMPPAIPFEERVQMRLQSALNYMAQKNYQNIVLVAYQQGAQSVLDYLAANQGGLPEQGFSIIWIDAALTEDQQLNFAKKIGDTLPIKMLDVVDASSASDIAAGKQRVRQATRNSYEGYSMVKLPINNTRATELNTLTQRIRGWLKVNAPGMNATIKKAN